MTSMKKIREMMRRKKEKPDSGIILTYHGIGNHPDWPNYMYIKPERFEIHLRKLKEHQIEIISVNELMDRKRTGKDTRTCVALCFDDGYEDNYSYALPLLRKYHARATFGLITSKIGQREDNGKLNYMNELQIREMIMADMEIASHTCNHVNLANAEKEVYKPEICESKKILEKKFPECKVDTLIYPQGEYNRKIQEYARKCGYKQAMAGDMDKPEEKNLDQCYAVKRVLVYDDGYCSGTIDAVLKRLR